MLTVVDPNWLTAKDENGQRRLDNPEDFVVIEIGVALARNIPVVPVLVDGAVCRRRANFPIPSSRSSADRPLRCAMRILEKTLKRSSQEWAR